MMMQPPKQFDPVYYYTHISLNDSDFPKKNKKVFWIFSS